MEQKPFFKIMPPYDKIRTDEWKFNFFSVKIKAYGGRILPSAFFDSAQEGLWNNFLIRTFVVYNHLLTYNHIYRRIYEKDCV